jgi:SAM-dependent methyltransferase
MMRAPAGSIRGEIRAWIERYASGLGTDVLEVGSRQHVPGAWWVINRDLAQGAWMGIDAQPGAGVDLVADVEALPASWGGRFTGVLCSEVIEHVRRPWRALPEIRRVMRPGGLLILTTVTTFHVHGFPDDYFRFTESGLRSLLVDAGFSGIETAAAGQTSIDVRDHNEHVHRTVAPIQAFAVARC